MSSRQPRAARRARAGFGFWIAVVLVLVLLLGVAGGASYLQNRELNRGIIEAYLGRSATHIASSAIEETYYRLHHGLLARASEDADLVDWSVFLLGKPDGAKPSQRVAPEITRFELQKSPDRPKEFTVEEIEDVTMTLVSRERDETTGFQTGVIELETAVRLRVGGFPAFVTVVRRVWSRKRYYAAPSGDLKSTRVRYLTEDISREVARQ